MHLNRGLVVGYWGKIEEDRVLSRFGFNCHTPFSFQRCIFFPFKIIKGCVQQKLRWVKIGVNRSVGALDCGAGHSFVVLFGFHLGFAIFPFLVSTAEIIGKFWKNR